MAHRDTTRLSRLGEPFIGVLAFAATTLLVGAAVFVYAMPGSEAQPRSMSAVATSFLLLSRPTFTAFVLLLAATVLARVEPRVSQLTKAWLLTLSVAIAVLKVAEIALVTGPNYFRYDRFTSSAMPAPFAGVGIVEGLVIGGVAAYIAWRFVRSMWPERRQAPEASELVVADLVDGT